MRTNLTKTLSHRVSARPPPSYDDRGFAVRLSCRPLSLAETCLSPATLWVHLTPRHRHRHRDNQRHNGGLFAGRTVLLLRPKSRKDTERREKKKVAGKSKSGRENSKKEEDGECTWLCSSQANLSNCIWYPMTRQGQTLGFGFFKISIYRLKAKSDLF